MLNLYDASQTTFPPGQVAFWAIAFVTDGNEPLPFAGMGERCGPVVNGPMPVSALGTQFETSGDVDEDGRTDGRLLGFPPLSCVIDPPDAGAIRLPRV